MTIDTYTIKSAYPEPYNTFNEINILSDNLIYSEVGSVHAGCQCNNMDNNDKVFEICQKISKLVKELDTLTKN